MSIIDKIRQVNPRQEKSVKFTPVTEGGLGLSRSPNNDDIKKPQQNVQAKYWYDKYEELVKEVSYHRKMDRQNLTELEDKVVVINEGLLDEIAAINNSDPLTPLEQKFVTLDQLAEHYRTFINRIQEQIATIGGGGIGDLVDDPSPQLGGNLDTNGKNITGSGSIDITGTVDVEGVTTFEDDVTFTGATSNVTWDASANDLEFDDDSRLKFGDGDDFQIWHGGTHTFMKNSTGEFRIRGDIISLERADDSEKYLEANVNEDVKLFYNGNEKFATTTSGITVTGNIVISNDGNIGSVGDTDSIAIDSSGNITASQNLTVTGETTHNDDVKFPGAHYDILWDEATSKFKFDDDAQCVFGSASGGDMRLFHSGGNSTIKNETGQFRLAGNDIRLQTQNNSEDYILCTDGGAVTLYYNDSAKLATTNTGVSVTGNVVISNDGNIGSVGDTDSIAIDSSGVVTFSQTPVFSSDLTISDDLNLLSDGAAIYFGADKDVFAFHVHNLGLSLKNTSTADDTPFVLTLQTGETDIAANDVLGRIQFQAPDEGTGSDAVAISAAIQAISEGDFSSSSNATALGFLTGVSGTATTKMTLSSAGNLTITGDAKVGTSQSAGVILTSPDSTEYRLIVANGGALSTSAV